MAEPASSSDRFLAAFARLEDAVEELVGGRRHRQSFGSMLRQAGKRSPAIRMYETDLREFAQLRNAIVHDRGHGYVIAEPHPEVVAEIERIAEIVLDPPRVADCIDGRVITLGPRDTVADAARAIRRHGHGQFPVYDDGRLAGLLTYRALARWLAERFDAGEGVDGATPLEEVLPHAGSAYVVVGRDATVLDVLDLFTEHAHRGDALTAVLVTRQGDGDEPPAGIITAADLPRLFALVGPNNG